MHLILKITFFRIPRKSELEETILIPEVMFHPARMRVKEFFDRLLNGLTSQPMQETDPSISDQVNTQNWNILTKYIIMLLISADQIYVPSWKSFWLGFGFA